MMTTSNPMQERGGVTVYKKPCPSGKCWHYDASTGTCTMISNCLELSCGPTQMTISFNAYLFGIDNYVFFGAAQPVWDSTTFKFHLTCDLGKCGMTNEIVGNELILKLRVEQDGSDRTRSAISDNTISLGDKTIITAPFKVSVSFKCVYDTTVNVQSAAFNVHDVTISGSTQSTGSLAGGFEMTLGSSRQVILGQILEVTITWLVQITNINFHIDGCTITQGTALIPIIKQNCLSKTLVVKYETAPATSVRFSYKTFAVSNMVTKQQKMTCFVKICAAGKPCDKANSDADCPNQSADLPLKYSVNGAA